MKRPFLQFESELEHPRRLVGRRTAAERGFTLIELTVVVVLIGVFATMAVPQVTYQLRDRRVHEAAQRVALIYQQARVRAMGQGGAILVRYDTSGSGHGTFTIQEGLVGGTATNLCALAPQSNCSLVNWNPPTDQSRTIEIVDIGKEPGLGDVFANLLPPGGGTGAAMDLCFTPLGRSFVRFASAGTFAPLAGVPQFQVFRGANGIPDSTKKVRTVVLLPTGISRLQL